MGSFADGATTTALLWTPLLALLFGGSTVFSQDLTERDALCNEEGCFVAYLQQKTFLNSWRACREMGGNLATTKHKEDADAVANLIAHLKLPDLHTVHVAMWIGLQRQPRQCTDKKPLRGFAWTTGDQDTEYTNWLEEKESLGSCTAPRCVVMTYSTQERKDNFKWSDRPCSVTVDGYICHYAYKGMCATLWNEGAGNILYETPFGRVSAPLTHVPFGSVASVALCDSSNTEEQSASCTVRDDGSFGWSRDPPLCPDSFVPNSCDKDNGGNRCEFECVPLSDDDYRCACPVGYMLASDMHRCLDVDECLQSPCEQLCVNAPGTFECRCRDGYNMDGHGVCEDVDECVDDPCEHVCENTPGTHVCHCYLGFTPALEDTSQCQDIDECQDQGTCQHMCVNYQGSYMCYCEDGFELRPDQYSCRKRGEVDDQLSAVTPPYPWATHQPEAAWPQVNYEWEQHQSQTDWAPEGERLQWLTDQPRVSGSDVIWVTSANQEDTAVDPSTQSPKGEKETTGDNNRAVDSSEWGQRFQTSTVNQTPPPNTTESSPSPFWYEAIEEETTTTIPPLLVTSTVSGGAWNWWAELTTSNQGLMDPDSQIRDHNMPIESLNNARETTEEHSYQETSQIPKELESDFFGSTKSQEVAATTGLTPSHPPLSEGGESGDEDVGSVRNRSPNQASTTWLLVGILVPVCIFVAVMVALGVTFGTRYASRPRGKEATDCYHWISGAHDKPGGHGPPTGSRTHV